MANYGMSRDENDRAPMRQSHPTNKYSETDLMNHWQKGYEAGKKEERERWMSQIDKVVMEALIEATAPEE